MPRRKTPLVNGEIYHTFNASVAGQPIFKDSVPKERFLELIDFYRFESNPLRYSHFINLSKKFQKKYLSSLYDSKRQVEVLGFALMPNHYHLLLRQKTENGISNFIRYIQDGFAKYLNLKSDRKGALFRSPFKAKRIESEDQLLHILRYIHLNPLTSYILKDINQLKTYGWNSYADYVNGQPRQFVDTETVLNMFNSKEDFARFVEDQVDYQRGLAKIRHIVEE